MSLPNEPISKAGTPDNAQRITRIAVKWRITTGSHAHTLVRETVTPKRPLIATISHVCLGSHVNTSVRTT